MARTKTQSGGLEDFTLQYGFTNGYRSREDKTILPPGILIPGSQNVLTNTYERIATRKGYTLDGQSNAVIAPILSSYDLVMRMGERNLRAGFLTVAGNDGKLQYRYVAGDGTVTWRDLMTGLSSVSMNFTSFWDFNTELKDFILFVDGSSNIYEWSGGVSTVLSSDATSLTINTDTSVAEENFYNLAPFGSFVAAGVDYAYTGVTASTFTGVSPSPAAIPVGTIIHQKVRVTANSAMTDIPEFGNNLISTLLNQVYVASFSNNTVYISKTNDYKDYSFTAPVRLVGEGALATLDGAPVAFVPQEDSMYISAGQDQWYKSQFTLSADLEGQNFEFNRLKTATQQGAQSQGLTTKVKNSVVFIDNVPIMESLGRVDNVVLTPQFTDLSFSIVNDMNMYDFTDGHVFYHKNFALVSVPREGKVLMYNMTDPANPYWEAPQILPICRFAVIGGELYGHSYQVGETYKLFDGTNDNGNSMIAVAQFSYMNYGTRSNSKGFNEWYSEGYIRSNTILNLGLTYEVDGCATITDYQLGGTQDQFVCIGSDSNSLGKYPLGKQPLGGMIQETPSDPTPPKFRWIRTFPITYFYEHTVEYSSSGTDQQWEILAFGPRILSAQDQNTHITD